MKSASLAAAIALTSLWPAAALAAPAPAQSRQQADEAVVRAAMAGGTFEGLGAHLDSLRAVLARAPARYPRIEKRGNLIIVRDEEIAPALDVLRVLTTPPDKADAAVRQELNVYGDAAFLLAAYSNEMKQRDVALAYADRGLALQPDNALLLTEKTSALEALDRAADALAAVERWEAIKPEASDRDRARVLRAKGYALVELHRLDEAEAAYRASLMLEPHKGAANELAFIDQQRHGQAGDHAAAAEPRP